MAIRNFNNQNEHDSVIQAAFSNLDKTNYNVYTNPNQQKNTHINGNYPDIIITLKNDNHVKFIIEVETADSVNNSEVNQWGKYSKLGGIFYLLVPYSCRQTAEKLVRMNGIKARFGTYRVLNGRYVINYE